MKDEMQVASYPSLCLHTVFAKSIGKVLIS